MQVETSHKQKEWQEKEQSRLNFEQVNKKQVYQTSYQFLKNTQTVQVSIQSAKQSIQRNQNNAQNGKSVKTTQSYLNLKEFGSSNKSQMSASNSTNLTQSNYEQNNKKIQQITYLIEQITQSTYQADQITQNTIAQQKSQKAQQEQISCTSNSEIIRTANQLAVQRQLQAKAKHYTQQKINLAANAKKLKESYPQSYKQNQLEKSRLQMFIHDYLRQIQKEDEKLKLILIQQSKNNQTLQSLRQNHENNQAMKIKSMEQQIRKLQALKKKTEQQYHLKLQSRQNKEAQNLLNQEIKQNQSKQFLLEQKSKDNQINKKTIPLSLQLEQQNENQKLETFDLIKQKQAKISQNSQITVFQYEKQKNNNLGEKLSELQFMANEVITNLESTNKESQIEIQKSEYKAIQIIPDTQTYAWKEESYKQDEFNKKICIYQGKRTNRVWLCSSELPTHGKFMFAMKAAKVKNGNCIGLGIMQSAMKGQIWNAISNYCVRFNIFSGQIIRPNEDQTDIQRIKYHCQPLSQSCLIECYLNRQSSMIGWYYNGKEQSRIGIPISWTDGRNLCAVVYLSEQGDSIQFM